MGRITIQTICEIAAGKPFGATNSGEIEHLIIDSRNVSHGAKSAFFAIETNRNNGHKFIDDAYQKGIRCFVVSRPCAYESFPDAIFIMVLDTVCALQQIAQYWRFQFTGKIIAVTGSNGKTVVKEWLHAVLQKYFYCYRSPKSYNSQIGVALSLWNIDLACDFAIIEAGISMPNEMSKLEPIIAPDIVIFTNIGTAHQINFDTLHHKAVEKLLLAKNAETLIFSSKYAELNNAIYSSALTCSKKSWGDATDSYEVTTNALRLGITQVEIINRKGEIIEYQLPFADNASIENSINVAICADLVGLSPSNISDEMSNLEPIEMRLELKEGMRGLILINDYYNNDINSLTIALDLLERQSKLAGLEKTVVLSDIMQSAGTTQHLYGEVASLLAKYNIKTIIGIGAEIAAFSFYFPKNAQFFRTTDAFCNSSFLASLTNCVVLLKGARDFRFEQISAQLEIRVHKTIFEINLNALVNNFNYFKSKLKPETKVMAMVKAFAYGSGHFEVARLLQYHGCNYLAVAVADEGAELRKAGIKLPIMVMAPEIDAFEKITAFQLEPEIYSFSVFEAFSNFLIKHGISNYPVHIKIDTGMHRLGFSQQEVDLLISKLTKDCRFNVLSVFSHLVGSDDATFDDFTQSQIELFDLVSQKIMDSLNYPIMRHILNSAGIERFASAQYDMVRLGIGLYGVSATQSPDVLDIGKLKTNIIQLRDLEASQTIGYSRKGVLQQSATIATIPIGYADGLDRRLGNGVGGVFIKGQKAPFIGNICMDMSMIDVTGLAASEGDEVIIFGDGQTVSQVAEAIGTIPYEILTGISLRVKRVYVAE